MRRRFLAILLLALLAGVACNSKPIISTASLDPTVTFSFTPALKPSLIQARVPLRTATSRAIRTPTPIRVAPLPGLVYYLQRGVRSGEYWQIRNDNQPRLLFQGESSFGGSYSFSADGNLLLQHDASREGGIWLVDLKTGKSSNLIPKYEGYICCARWWPGRSDKMLLGSWQPGDDVTISNGYLTELNLNSLQLRVLDKETVFFGAEPSPDGKVIAYSDGQGNGWLSQEGKSRRTFKPEQYGLTAEGLIGVGNPSWSPDGTKIAWVVAGDFDATGERYGVAVFDLKQKTAQLLHSYQIGGTDRWPSAALWSSDSQWLAFDAVAEHDDYGLWVAKADDTEKYHLASDLRSMTWSPDSRFLAFTTGHSTHQGWITQVGNWQLQPLDLPTDVEVAAWSNPTSQ